MDPSSNDNESTSPSFDNVHRLEHFVRERGLSVRDAQRVVFMERYVTPAVRRCDIDAKLAEAQRLNRAIPMNSIRQRRVRRLKELRKHYAWLERERQFALDNGGRIDWAIE